MNVRTGLVAATAAGIGLAAASLADDWPQWLGPTRSGISTEQGQLLAQPRVLWTNEVGLGCCSVVISAGRAFTLGHTKGQGERGTDTVYCLDAETGTTQWKFSYPCRSCVSQDVKFDGPRATPCVDGDRVYTLSLEGHLFCLDAATGRLRWSRELPKDFGGRIPVYGYCGSPMVYRNLLLLELNAPDASFLALDKMTGEPVWQAAGGQITSGSPVLMQVDGADCAVFMGGGVVMGLDPATGRALWRHGTWGHAWLGPVVWSNYVFVANASLPRGCGLLQIESGRPKVLWEDRRKFQSLHNNAIIWQQHIYGVDNTGTDLQHNDNSRSRLKCLELHTGQERWAQDRFGWSNVLLWAGKLLVWRQVGELVIAEPTPERYRELGRHTFLHQRSWSVPALANGRLYCRGSNGAVVCVQLLSPALGTGSGPQCR